MKTSRDCTLDDRNVTRPIPISLIVVLIGLAGCSDGTSMGSSLVRDSAGITIVENSIPLWLDGGGWRVSGEPMVDIGQMDGAPEYQFYQIAGAVRIRGGRLAVANGGSGEIRLYSSSGEFLEAKGGKGSGPGEFEDIFFFRRAPSDSLLAYDWRNRRLSVLSPQGDFSRSFEFTVLTTSGGFPIVNDPFPDGDLLLATDMFSASTEVHPGAKRDSAVYYVIDPEGDVRTRLGAYPGGESYETTDGENWVGGGLVFGKFGYAAVSGAGFYFGDSERFEIEYRNKAGDLLRLLRLDHENLPVTQVDIDTYIADRMERARPERRQIYRTMYDNMPFPEFMPAFGDLFVDAGGNLWVGVYRRPGDEQPRWHVFDPGGAYLGIVETPQRFRIFEIGEDYLLGRWTDEYDVEHVRVYGLVKD
jgi:hypothetical protein